MAATRGEALPEASPSPTEYRWMKALSLLSDQNQGLAKVIVKHLHGGASWEGRRMLTLAQDNLKQVLDQHDKDQTRIQVGSRSIVVVEWLRKFGDFLIAMKSYIEPICQMSPYASLAATGIFMLLPLAVASTKHNSNMLEGLERISQLICVYMKIDTQYLAKYPPPVRSGEQGSVESVVARDHMTQSNLHKLLVKIYCKIFEYQARMYRHLTHRGLHRWFSAAKGTNDWKDMLHKLEGLDRHRDELTQLLDSERTFEREKEQDALDKERLVISKDHQDIARDHLDTSKDHLNVSKAQASVQMQQVDLTEKQLGIQSQILEAIEILPASTQGTTIFGETTLFLQLLSANNPFSKELQSQPIAVEGTCAWLAEHRAFIRWRQSREPTLLWLSAGPGFGKSVLCRYLIDNGSLVEDSSNVIATHFFFRNRGYDGTVALRAILAQIFAHPSLEHLIVHGLRPFRAKGRDLGTSTIDLWKILIDVASDPECSGVVCLLDALDECPEGDELLELLARFHKRSQEKVKLKFIVTSRRTEWVVGAFVRLHRNAEVLEVDGNDHVKLIQRDIELYLRSEIDYKFWKFTSAVKDSIYETLSGGANRTFLWVSLALAAILKLTDDQISNRQFENVPRSIGEAYERYLKQCQDQALALDLLMMVVAAERQIELFELRNMLAGRFESYSEQQFRNAIENGCGQLLQVENNSVFLLHQTVREFLTAERDMCKPQYLPGQFRFEVEEANAILADKAMAYLEGCISRGRKPHPDHYASAFWASHFNKAALAWQQTRTSQALWLCKLVDQWASDWFLFTERASWPRPKGSHIESHGRFRELRVSAMLGLIPVVEESIRSAEGKITGHFIDRSCALSAALVKGQVQAAIVLLRAGASVNPADKGRFQLSRAAQLGSLDLFNLLLQGGADRHSPSIIGMDQLTDAVSGMNIGIVRATLSFDIDNSRVDFENGPGGRALADATVAGRLDIIDLLIKSNVRVNSHSEHERSDFLRRQNNKYWALFRKPGEHELI